MKTLIDFRGVISLACLVLVMSLSGCNSGGSSSDGGDVVNDTELPADYALNLYCPNEGIAAETCILDNPENVFADSIVNDQTKWTLDESTSSPKSKYFLWGTAQALSPRGENQYYTAVALHDLHTQGGSQVAKAQAIKAYRSVLDNYFDDITYFDVAGELLPQALNTLTVNKLLLRSEEDQIKYAPLYSTQTDLLNDLSNWGYNYDISTGIITKNQ